MTNGEMIQKIFNCEVCEPIIEEDIIHVIFPDKNDSAIGFDWSWWNAEYKEPTTKNNLGVDAISREQALIAIRNLYPGMPRVDFNGSLRKWVDKYKPYIECDDAIKQLPPVTPQELIHGKCNQCKYYEGVHNVQGHAPCSYHKIGGVLWNWYCSQFESEG